MPEFNLLRSVPSIKRSVAGRLVNKEQNRAEALKFGEAYFDGTREQGYGGYTYDGRWKAVAQTAREKYGLKAGDRVLDIGCAKGFFVHDLTEEVPGITVQGVDISAYAIENALPAVCGQVSLGAAEKLPFADNSFDAVFSINTIHNLDRAGCVKALSEMVRVCKNPSACFVQVDAYRNADELAQFEAWMLTAKTYCTPDEWHQFFKEAHYTGDYFWTILEFDETE